MEFESIRKNWNTVLFSVVTALFMPWTPLPVHAVGPYFENESPGRGQFEGPNPGWSRPDAFLWSPPSPAFRPQESLKKGSMMRSAEESSFLVAPKQIVKGEVLRIEGEFYVLRDSSGNELALQVDNDSQLQTIPKLGDEIEAMVTPLFAPALPGPAVTGPFPPRHADNIRSAD